MTFLIQNAKFKDQNDKKPERNIELRSGFFREFSEFKEFREFSEFRDNF